MRSIINSFFYIHTPFFFYNFKLQQFYHIIVNQLFKKKYFINFNLINNGNYKSNISKSIAGLLLLFAVIFFSFVLLSKM